MGTGTSTLVAVTEASGKVTAKSGRSQLIQLIDPGWGSSGFYSPEVLELAAQERVFPAGTHMYLDHPTATENEERPERSVKDLAAVLASDATWSGAGLVAEVTVFAPYREAIKEMGSSIGVSIRASAMVSDGEAEGRRGRLIERLIPAPTNSVDWVTHAGRGGKVLEVLESARAKAEEARNLGQWLESRIHQHFTNIADDLAGEGHMTREERIGLSSAIGDALAAFNTRIAADQPHLYERDPFADPTAPAPVGESDVSASRPDSTTKSKEGDMPNIEIDEAEHKQLVEKAGRVDTLESERDTEKARADAAEAKLAEATSTDAPPVRSSLKLLNEQLTASKRENATLRAENVARPILAEALADAILVDSQKARLGRTLLVDLPLTEALELDQAAFGTRCQEAIGVAEEEAAELLQAAGVGTPRGLGGVQTPATEAASAKFDEDLGEALQSIGGLSESATKIAVKGR